jgi:two-component system chemotaxis sensor kinase CheA
VVLSSGATRIAFLVHEVLNKQEVLVKGLGRQLARVRDIAGATLLGSGKLVPVLNVADLLRSAVKAAADTAPVSTGQSVALPAPKAVLVVEDSITSRALLKGILESAGYEVSAAVDGVDSFVALKSRKFDLVVSDVDMPKMNGFNLTARIRSDKFLSELPVVLVTALGSWEHRERGIDVGANAYIVKSDFDQSNLLQVIRQLI